MPFYSQLHPDEETAFLKCGAIISLTRETVLLAWGKRIQSQVPDNKFDYNWYSPNFFLNSAHPYFQHPYFKVIALKEFPKIPAGKQPCNWKKFDASRFDQTFVELKEIFKSKHLSKAVPYLGEEAPFDALEQLPHMLQCAFHYAETHPGTFIYGFWDEKGGMLGVTPEILFKMDAEGSIATMACAGTVRSQDADQLLHDPKLQFEHQLVVDAIVSHLKPHGEVSQGPQSVKRFASIAHLITPIVLKPKEIVGFERLAELLHPTPALGTFPKENGAEWLSTYDLHYPRQRYGAPFGIKEKNGTAACYVAIRNAQWSDSKARILAGCGVVQDSVLEVEKNEIAAKIAAIKEILGV